MKRSILSLAMALSLVACGQKKSSTPLPKGGIDNVTFPSPADTSKRPMYTVILNDNQWNLVLKVMDMSAAGNLEVKQAMSYVYPQLQTQQQRYDSQKSKVNP